MSEDNPLVSVGLPTFNRVGSLRRAAESVLAQDYPNLELIISDNASTDETRELCEELCRLDDRVRYVRQTSNRGATANFHEVLDRSRGKFFMWLSDDDWLDRSYVTVCVRKLIEEADCALVGGRVIYCETAKTVFEETPMNLLSPHPSERVYAYYRRVGPNGTFYGVMRRDQLIRVPLQDALGGDWLVIASVAFLGKIRTLDEVAVYRSFDGASRDIRGLAASFGLSTFDVRHPHLTIARIAFHDVAWSSPVYASMGRVSRIRLATQAFAILFARYCVYAPIRRIGFRLGFARSVAERHLRFGGRPLGRSAATAERKAAADSEMIVGA